MTVRQEAPHAAEDAPVAPVVPVAPVAPDAPDAPEEDLGAPGGGPDAPDSLDSLCRWRLRPGVAATVLGEGVHLRGWITSVSLEGSPALPALWEQLADALATDGGAALAGAVPAGSRLRAALVQLIDRLREHDFLVERDIPGGPAGPWLGTVADRPAEAAALLARTRTRVLGPHPGGALARAAGRALERTGAGAERLREAGLPAGRILLVASVPGGPDRAVAAEVVAGSGFVTPVGSPAQARADAEALAERLGRRAATAPGSGEHPALTALVASAAAQRLLCAAAGLRDPSAEAGDARLLPGRPAVLVAADRPLRGEYRTWLGPALLDADRVAPGAVPATLADALARIPVLGDAEVGVVDAPDPGALPQLPVALVRCAAPGGALLSGAARADLARLEAVCRAAELHLGGERPGPAVGVNPEHARGRALRRAVPLDGGPFAVVGAPVDTLHAQARHWWSVLVRRLGVDAELEVSRTGSGAGVFRAVVRGRAAGVGSVAVLGAAVEATADDAVAYAALSAVVRVRAGGPARAEAGTRALLGGRVQEHRYLALPSGATAVLAAGADPAPWEDGGWTAVWLGETAGRERAFQQALAGLTGASPRPWEPAGGASAHAHALRSALRQCGFSVLTTEPASGPDLDPGSGPTEGLR
ncbi:hypothetical protein [Streptomyces sp. NPDC001889]